MAGKRKQSEYERKRDFSKTKEPVPEKRPESGKRRRRDKGKPRFVVQEHSARRLHWDLRLEHDGAAASWAIPNGIPMDPKQNRKAIRTEDHPLEYLTWEGEIPKGEYGAGTMRVWDSGTYELEKWTDEKVMADFEGEKLRGRYAIFRAGKSAQDWMIHRIDPPEREADPFPEAIVPMLAKLAPLPASDEGWAVEVKWDGVRAIAYCQPGRLELQTRNLNTVTDSYPEVRRLSRQIGARDAVLDGELVVFDPEGKPSFELLQQRIHQTSEAIVRRRMKTHPVVYMVFDLLYLDGRNLMDEPYTRRRELLEGLGLEGESWQTPGYLKRLDSRYAPGKRNGSWLKVKNLGRQEFVIGGWLPGEGRRKNTLGALLLGYHDADLPGANELRYAGKVGTGFSDRDLKELLERLRPLARKSNPFGRKGPKGANYVEPRLVAEVEYRELTHDGLIRHGAFKGLREDKPASEVELERAVAEASANAGAGRKGAKKSLVTVEGRELALSNLDKVLYPEVGFTKGQVIDYYARVAEVLLPHLRGRPLTMKRYPDGVEGQHFYEKRSPKHRPEWVQTARIWSGSNDEDIDFTVVEDLPTLIWAANLADLELHTSLSLAADMERPTAIVFDLDPGAPADVLDCAQVAIWIRGLFDRIGLRCCAKTSGSKGMHLHVPLNTEVSYEQTKPFAKAVAETLETKFGDHVVSSMAKKKRAGKVLIDWSQNDQHKTTVSVYSLRAKPHPTVSTPLEWDELEAAFAAGDASRLVFDADQALRRINEKGDLYAPLLSERQFLPE
jgi:bifunctional non-homologous end joining protein LigD